MYVDSYNHFKVIHVRIVRNPLLTHLLLFRDAAVVKKILHHKNFTDTLNKIDLSIHSIRNF